MPENKQASRDDLIRLVIQIKNESGCIVDLDALINKFESSVKVPSASQLIFDPPDGRNRTPEEIVDIALGKIESTTTETSIETTRSNQASSTIREK